MRAGAGDEVDVDDRILGLDQGTLEAQEGGRVLLNQPDMLVGRVDEQQPRDPGDVDVDI